MPFGSFFRRDKSSERSAVANMSDKEKKERLSLKAMQAQTSPDAIYDLSDCGATMIPDNTYTYCKLLMKKKLLLQNNCLSSLDSGDLLSNLSGIEVLDVSRNKIDSIPDSIGKLENLRVLNLSYNKIKSLPPSIKELKNLEEMSLSHNKLSKVPIHLCALPRLKVLSLDGNNIKVLPKELVNLQKSLSVLSLSTETIKDPPQNVVTEGIEAIMKLLCSTQGIEYEGIIEAEEDTNDSVPMTSESPVVDEMMIDYIAKKKEQQLAQIKAEEKMQALEKEQLEAILASNTSNKEDLLKELSQVPDEAIDYEKQKLEKLKDHINIVENYRDEQDIQLGAYLNNTSFKEAMKSDLLIQQRNLDQEVEVLVSAKEIEHGRLLKDLTAAEEETTAALAELVNAGAYRKSGEFISLMQAQEKQMDTLLASIAEESAEGRQNDVAAAMQSVLFDAAIAESQKRNVESQNETWVNNLLKENNIIDCHIEEVLSNKASDQDAWVSKLLNDEECQAAAFKLLLMENDLKRNSILRQVLYHLNCFFNYTKI